MPENIKSKDWFYERTLNQMSGNYADILNNNPEQEFDLKPKEDYLQDPQIVEAYKNEFGDEYKNKIEADYNVLAKDYQNYREGKFNVFATSEYFAMPGMGYLTGHKERKVMTDVRATDASLDGARVLFGEITAPTVDIFKAHADSDIFFTSDGKAHKMPSKEEVMNSYRFAHPNLPTDNPFTKISNLINEAVAYFSDDDASGAYYAIDNPSFLVNGKKVMGWAYREGSTQEGSKMKPGYQAILEGEYLDSAHLETASIWDIYNPRTSREAGAFDFVPRSLLNFASGIEGTVINLGAAADSFIRGNEAAEDWAPVLLRTNLATIKPAAETREGSALGSWDAAAGLVSDVILQLLSGRAMASSAVALTSYGLRAGAGLGSKAALRALQTGSLYNKAAATGSIVGMSLYGAKDTYQSALAAGFSAREAATLYTGVFGSMLLVNKFMNPLQNAYESWATAKSVMKVMKPEIDGLHKTIISGLRMADEASEESAKKAILDETAGKVTKNIFSKTMGNIAKNTSKLSSISENWAKTAPGILGVLESGTKEAAEETAEFLSEEAVKQGFQALKHMFPWEAEGGREGHFLSPYDPGYWEYFKEGITSSAVGGFIGGAITKAPGFRKILGEPHQNEVKESMLDYAMSGQGEAYKDAINKLHKEGKLADTKLSTVYDPETQTFIPVTEDNKLQSMNDATKDILLQQYEYVNSVINALGGVDIFKQIAKNKPEIVKALTDNSLVKDIKDLSREYLDIMATAGAEPSSNPNGSRTIYDPKLTEDEQKQKIDNFATAYNMDTASVERLVEIEKELNDIKTGKSASKYFFEALSKGTSLDYDNLSEDMQEKFGKNILYNLIQNSEEEIEASEENFEEIANVIKENDKLISELKNDLSNIDTITHLLKEGKIVYLSQKAKDKITDLYENYESPEKSIKNFKEKLTKKAEEFYSVENITKSPEYNSLTSEDAKNRYLFLAQNFYKNKIDFDIKSAETIKELEAVEFNDPLKTPLLNLVGLTADQLLPELIDEYGIPISYEEKLEDLLNSESNTLVDFRALVEQIKINLYDKITLNRIKGLAKYNEYLNFESEDYLLLKELHALTKNKENLVDLEELDYLKGAKSVEHLIKGFSGDKNKLKSSNNLKDIIEALEKQKNDERIKNPNINTFNSLEEVQSALFQVKARLEQVDFLLQSNSFSYIDLDTGEEKIKTNTTKGVLAYDNLKKLYPNLNASTFGSLIQDNNKYAELFNKENKTKEEEKEFSILSGKVNALSESYVFLKDLKNRLESLEELAKEGKENLKGGATIHKDSMISAMKKEEDELLSLLDATDLGSNEIIKDYTNWTAERTQDERFKLDEDIIANFEKVTAVKSLLFNLSSEEKSKIIDAYTIYVSALTENNSPLADTAKKEKIKNAFITLELNRELFYSEYNKILQESEGPETSTGEQDTVIMELVAQLTSDAGSKFIDYAYNNEEGNRHAAVVYGVQGSGKSSYVLGTALKIAQIINEGKVLLASNQPEQVDILSKTMQKFGVSTSEHSFHSEEVVNGKWTPKKLLGFLSKIENTKDINAIVFDEATYLEYTREDAKKVDYKNKTDLAKLLQKVEDINKAREKTNEPALRIIFTGDPSQNGYYSKDGEPKNLSAAIGFFRTPKLIYNFRTRIESINIFVRNKILKENKENLKVLFTADNNVDNITSSYGYVQGTDEKLLGGIKFSEKGKTRQDLFNDEEFINNIQRNIEDAIKEGDSEPFKIGIILPSLQDVPAEDTKLGTLIKSYRDNFKLTTHNSVQGQEFDYVISIVTKEDIGDSFASHGANASIKEKAAASKLATTIGRARYFSYIHNETSRTLNSVISDDIFIVDKSLDESLAREAKDLKIAMYSTIQPINAEAVKKDSKLRAEEEKEKEEAEKRRIEENLAKKEKARELLEKYLAEISEGTEIKIKGVSYIVKKWDGDRKIIFDNNKGVNKAIVFDDYGNAYEDGIASNKLLKEDEFTYIVKKAEDVEPITYTDYLEPQDKIIWGHPGLGKTTFKENNPDTVLDFDTDFKPKIAEELELPIDKQNSEGLNEWRKQDPKNEEKFSDLMRKYWGEALIEAKQTNKFLVVSDMLFLRENAKDFDKIISIDKETFINRATQRGDDTTNLESWKNSIDKAISSVDQDKVIFTDKYFNELVDNTADIENEANNEEGYKKYVATIKSEFIQLANQEVTPRGFDILMNKLSDIEDITISDKAEINDEILKIKEEKGLLNNEENLILNLNTEDPVEIEFDINLSGKSEEDLELEIEEKKEEGELEEVKDLEQELKIVKEINENLTDDVETEDGFDDLFVEIMTDNESKNKDKLSAKTALTALNYEGFDTSYFQWAGKLEPGENREQAIMKQIKNRIDAIYGDGFHPADISYEDYTMLQLEAFGLSENGTKAKAKYSYEVAFFINEENDLNTVYVATDDKGRKILLGFPLLKLMDSVYRNKYVEMANSLEVTEDNPKIVPLSTNADNILNLRNLSPGGLVADRKNPLGYTIQEKERLERENPGLKISNEIFISTQAYITNEQGESIENPFRGEAFVLYTYNQNLNSFSPEQINNVLMKGIRLKNSSIFREHFDNGIGMMRLDNKPLSFREIFDTALKNDIDRKDLTGDINNSNTQRVLAGFFADIIISDADLFNNLSEEAKQILVKYSDEQAGNINGVVKNIINKNNSLLQKFKDSSEDSYQKKAYKLLRGILSQKNFGKQAIDENGELKWGNVKGSDKKYPIIEKDYNNIIKIVPASSGDVSSNAQFEMDLFMADIDLALNIITNKEGKVESDRIKEQLFNLLDGLRKNAPKINKGIYAKPRIDKKASTKNKMFAKAKNSNFIYFQHNIERFTTPLLRVNRELLENAITDYLTEEKEEIITIDTQSELLELESMLNQLTSKSSKEEINEVKNKLEDLADNEIITEIEKDNYLKQLREATAKKRQSKKDSSSVKKIQNTVNKARKATNDADMVLESEEKAKQLLDNVESSLPFLVDVNELDFWINQLDKSVKEIEYFKNADKSLAVDLTDLSEKVKQQLQNIKASLSKPEAIEEAIQNNLMQTITDLPVVIGASIPSTNSSTKELLIAYHNAKNKGNIEERENIANILEEKYKKPLGLLAEIKRARKLLNTPTTTIEEFQSAIELLLRNDVLNNDEIILLMNDKIKSMQQLEIFKEALNNYDYDTATKEDYLQLLDLVPEGEAKTIFLDSLERNISDELGLEGERIIRGDENDNFTLSGYKNFLSSSTENKVELDKIKEEWKSTKEEIKDNLRFYTYFIVDESKSNKLIKETEIMINEIDNKILAEEEKYNKIKEDITASSSNRFPGKLDTQINNQDRNFILSLEGENLEAYTDYVNGKINPVTDPKMNIVLNLMEQMDINTAIALDAHVAGCK